MRCFEWQRGERGHVSIESLLILDMLFYEHEYFWTLLSVKLIDETGSFAAKSCIPKRG